MNALIERVQSSAVQDGDCWRWIGARQTNGSTPVMQWQGKVGNVRRFILIDAGVAMGRMLAGVSCGNPECVNPAHVVKVSRRQVSQEAADAMDHTSKTLRAMRTAAAARTRRNNKLTEQGAASIRLDYRPQRMIAAEYGVTQHTVWAIKAGRMWREYRASANPFSALY